MSASRARKCFAQRRPTLARMLELDPTPEELEAIGTAAMTLMLFLVPWSRDGAKVRARIC